MDKKIDNDQNGKIVSKQKRKIKGKTIKKKVVQKLLIFYERHQTKNYS